MPDPKDAPSDVERDTKAVGEALERLRSRNPYPSSPDAYTAKVAKHALARIVAHAEALKAAIAAFVTVYRGTDTTRYSLDEEVAAFNRLAALTGPGEPEDGDTIDDHLRRAYERDRAGTVDPLLARCPTCGLTYQRTHDGLAHVRCPDNFHDQVRHTAQPTPRPEDCPHTDGYGNTFVGLSGCILCGAPTPSEGSPSE